MRALSLRQPYVEQVLRGIKKIEYRSSPTRIIGEQFYLYASKMPGPAEGFYKLGCHPADLPTGVLLGTARISKCTGANYDYEWHLTDVKRLKRPRKPTKKAQPAWFNPF
jgi:hypothetical protein